MAERFQPDAATVRAVEAGMKLLRVAKRGETIFYRAFEDVTGLNKDKDKRKWSNFVRGLRQRAREELRVIILRQHWKEISVVKGGFKVATVRDMIEHIPKHRRRKKKSQDKRSLEAARTCPEELMTDRERAAFHAQAQSLEDERRATDAAAKRMRALFGGIKTEPRG